MAKELLWRATGSGSNKQSLQHVMRSWATRSTTTVDTLDNIQERRKKKAAINTSRTRAEKVKSQAEYTKVNKQVKRSIRTDKRKYVEDLAMTAEKAAREGNIRQFYNRTKKLSENHRKPERPVKSKEDKSTRSTELTHIEAAPTDLPIDVGPPTIEEISMAIRQIKSVKAAGPDNIPADALKADVAATARILHILFNNIRDEEQVPRDWKEGLLGYHSSLNIRKSLQQGIVKQDDGLRRRPTSRPTGRIP
ncbi:unnamed protein product [Schistosoma mattheei]|uniref:Uncharacterized protein n=1 Tax=Schistosoma mattheei TaxID=31246 RepID=A0A183NU06_9TREM|nr:unnamed protein product [Schistosoma mattheei]